MYITSRYKNLTLIMEKKVMACHSPHVLTTEEDQTLTAARQGTRQKAHLKEKKGKKPK